LTGSLLFVNTTNKPPTGCPPNLTNAQLWPPSSIFTSQYPLCGELLGEIHYNATTKRYDQPPGTATFTRNFGGFGGIQYFDPNWFAGAGYKPLVNLFGAPYDWRMAPDGLQTYFNQMKLLIQEVVNATKSKVVIFAESNGPMTALGFLYAMSTQWKQQYVCGFAPTSPVWGGTPWPVGVATTGTGAWGGISPADARILANTWPSSMWNMPRYGTTPGTFNNSVIFVYTQTKNYTANMFGQYLTDMGYSDSAILWEKVKDVTSGSFPDPGVNVLVSYGTGVNTPSAFVVSHLTKDPNNTPTIDKTLYVSGDGMVMDPSSLRANYSWFHSMASKKLNLTYLGYPGLNHAQCYTNGQCLQDTFRVINHWDCAYKP